MLTHHGGMHHASYMWDSLVCNIVGTKGVQHGLQFSMGYCLLPSADCGVARRGGHVPVHRHVPQALYRRRGGGLVHGAAGVLCHAQALDHQAAGAGLLAPQAHPGGPAA